MHVFHLVGPGRLANKSTGVMEFVRVISMRDRTNLMNEKVLSVQTIWCDSTSKPIISKTDAHNGPLTRMEY